jgi:broad specificity phosphatase PhoE
MTQDQSNWNLAAYFVRHGTTTLNEQDKYRGNQDVPLDETGILDAKKLAMYFQDKELGDAWSSDRKRAEQTAEIVLDGKGQTASPDPNFKGIDVGTLSGKPKSEHKDDEKFLETHPDEPFPGGESVNQFRRRVQPPIKRSIMSGIRNKVPSISFVHASVIHEVGNVIHGDHNICTVRPGGVAGVFTDGKQLMAKALVRPEKEEKKLTYSS